MSWVVAVLGSGLGLDCDGGGLSMNWKVNVEDAVI